MPIFSFICLQYTAHTNIEIETDLKNYFIFEIKNPNLKEFLPRLYQDELSMI
jgi:hypothetical protein